MTEIPALYGTCKILSLATAPNPYVGITDEGQSSATVSLGQVETIWNITTQPSGHGLRFSNGRYPFTGIEDGVTIIATLDPDQDVAWNTTYVFALQAYLISPWDQPHKAWTVQDSTLSDSPIILQTLDESASQQFKAQQLDSLD